MEMISEIIRIVGGILVIILIAGINILLFLLIRAIIRGDLE